MCPPGKIIGFAQRASRYVRVNMTSSTESRWVSDRQLGFIHECLMSWPLGHIGVEKERMV